MKYENTVSGVFIERPNRFIARVSVGGEEKICHVKNTGRCRELLLPGATVYLAKGAGAKRKTEYDLVAVEKKREAGNLLLVNMDSQAPNAAAKEWLLSGGLGDIQNLKAESFHGDSRFDFSFIKDGRRCFLEVKGVTLENDGICAFPDAPTQRGAKHLKELTQAVREGFGAYVLFVIQMKGIRAFTPNDNTHKAFGDALRNAAAAGVKILAYDCAVTPGEMLVDMPIDVEL